MRRRDFITLLGSAAASWPLAARAQQGERMRRVGVLMSRAADDPEGQARIDAFRQGLQELGWIEGRNVQVDTRWPAFGFEEYRKYATELVAVAPDVILAAATPSVLALQQVSRTVPIVFTIVVDPVGSGIVASLARPGGNVTGFMQFEYTLSGKWLELLKQIAPSVTRVAVIRDFVNPAGIGQFAVIQAVAPTLGVDVIPVDARDAAEIEREVGAFARSVNGGLIVTGGRAAAHRDRIIALAIRHRLPAVYPERFYVAAGGLVSYGSNLVDHYRRAAGYVDRILKGEKPADLPVQAPTKYGVTLNLKAAKALGLDVPATVLARADEVIE
jgi:putative tryptophan/tyrosine transport system substrate-binding protein